MALILDTARTYQLSIVLGIVDTVRYGPVLEGMKNISTAPCGLRLSTWSLEGSMICMYISM
jgi:hypothetical protein